MDNSHIHSLVLRFQAINESRKSLNERNGHKKYLRQIERAASLFHVIAESSDFAECLAVIEIMQEYDLNFLAQTDNEHKNILASMDRLRIGEIHYRALVDAPGWYHRLIVEGFQKSECFEKGTLPRDSMQRALASHLQHVKSRNSIMLHAEEKELVAAQTELVETMIGRYTQMQRDVVDAHSEKPSGE